MSSPSLGDPSFEKLLNHAAALCGIEPEYWDIFGHHHVTTSEAKQAILRAMGWNADTAEDLRRSLADRELREWRRLAPPAIVALESDQVEVPLGLSAERLGADILIEVR